jgi:hypothetical protein
LGTNLVS